MEKLKIDINCDLGESSGALKLGNDELVFPFISSCNIACGFHGGDPKEIEKTLQLAKKYKTRIGAHPSYPDSENFGRKRMYLEYNELKAILKYQIAALKGMAESNGLQLEYVKPHGALYNAAAEDKNETNAIIDAIKEIDPNLAFMGLAGTVMESLAVKKHVKFIPEAFADRRYERTGRLMSRKEKGAVIHDSDIAANQVLMIIKENKVKTRGDHLIFVRAKSICVHGDNPNAESILLAIDQILEKHKIIKTSKA